MLTDTKIRFAKPREKVYRMPDGRGLVLLIHPNGGKYWQVRFRFNGREQTASLGTYPAVTLSDARGRLEPLKQQIRSGLNPNQVAKAAKAKAAFEGELTFERVTRLWFGVWSKNKAAKTVVNKWGLIERDLLPYLGHLQIACVGRKEVILTLEQISQRGVGESAKRALQIAKCVMDFAVLREFCNANPLNAIRASAIIGELTTRHHAKVSAEQLPEFLEKIVGYQGVISRYAMLLVAMTFVRVNELMGARWEEFDLEAARWVVPADRMKKVGGVRKPHIVPLSSQAIRLLKNLKGITGDGEYLFPGKTAKTLSNNPLLNMLKNIGFGQKMTVHGWRSIASTVLHDHGFAHLAIERQLAHVERNESSAPYNHAEFLQQRAELMQWWSDYLHNCYPFEKAL